MQALVKSKAASNKIAKSSQNVSAPKLGPTILPARCSRSMHAIKSVIQEDSLVQVEYIKKAYSAFNVLLADVPNTSTETKPCYDILWKMPGYSTSSTDPSEGTVCQLNQTVLKLENLSDFLVHVRLQRPMGFKADPTSIAMWEPVSLSQKELVFAMRPLTHHLITVSNGTTSLMCPRQVSIGGDEYVHLLSVSFYREYLNIHGNDVKHEGNCMALYFEAHYRNNASDAGNKEKDFTILTFPTSTHMDYTVPGPVQQVRLADAVEPGNIVRFAILDVEHGPSVPDSGIYLRAITTDSVGIADKTVMDFPGLDPKVRYRLPFGFDCKFTAESASRTGEANVIEYCEARKLWRLVYMYINADGKPFKVQYINTMTLENTTQLQVLSAGERLTPIVLRAEKPRVSTKIKAVKCLPSRQISHGEFHALRQSGTSTVLNTVVEIIKAVKIGISFAAALGFLSIKDQVVRSGPDSPSQEPLEENDYEMVGVGNSNATPRS